jgi:transcriptional regulator with XRE-family HTH domain
MLGFGLSLDAKPVVPLQLGARAQLKMCSEFKMCSERFFWYAHSLPSQLIMASRSSRPVDAYVGRRARQRRLELGLSCEAVAQVVALPMKRLQDFEGGFLRLEPAELADVAEALQVPLGYFYGQDTLHESLQGPDVSRFQAFGPRLTPSTAQQFQENADRQKNGVLWIVAEECRSFYAFAVTEDGVGSGWLAADSLAELRQYLPLGLFRSDVQPSETPGIIEVWGSW